MDILNLALAARLPFIRVATDDILNVGKVLSHLSGVQAKQYTLEVPVEEGGVFYTSMEDPPQKLYSQAKMRGASIVFINTKPSVLHFDGGTLLPPKELILQQLKEFVSDKEADELLPAFGGMTLKDTFEIILLTLKKDEKLTAKGVNKVRQGYVSKLRGISQVDTEYSFYQVPSCLKSWVDENLSYFSNEVHPSLTPRGLLFDGPPGTGKTMAAKYLAQSLGMPLYRIDIGTMKGKYVGDSESNLNAALAQIDQAAPCVVVLDEVEKIFGGASSDSGVTSSLLGALLWWLQEHKTKVFTVMTTNNKNSIPSELYREGRIDTALMFQGLETQPQALEFSMFVMKNLCTTGVGALTETETKQAKTRISELLETEFLNGQVPQVKVVQMVNQTVKRLLNARKEKE